MPPEASCAQSGHTEGMLPDQRSSTRRALRILVVDDLVDAAESLAIYLRIHGHLVRTAHNGLTALAEAAAFVPQVILLDIGLPQLDGCRVAEQIRHDSALQNACLIGISGHCQPEDARAALAAGMEYYLLKPVDSQALLGLLDTVAARQSAVSE